MDKLCPPWADSEQVSGIAGDIKCDAGQQACHSAGTLFRCLYDNVEEYTTNVGDAIIVIAQYQYEYGFVVDKEICIAAMLNKLLKL